MLKSIPEVWGLPLVGASLSYEKSPIAFYSQKAKKYGSVFRAHIFGEPTVILGGEKAANFIFRGENKYLENEWPQTTRVLLGEECTANLKGTKHRLHRQTLNPLFDRKAAKIYIQ